MTSCGLTSTFVSFAVAVSIRVVSESVRSRMSTPTGSSPTRRKNCPSSISSLRSMVNGRSALREDLDFGGVLEQVLNQREGSGDRRGERGLGDGHRRREVGDVGPADDEKANESLGPG